LEKKNAWSKPPTLRKRKERTCAKVKKWRGNYRGRSSGKKKSLKWKEYGSDIIEGGAVSVG